MPLISVFTPSYNRASKIHRVFKSLLNQTFKDFEWIIVDDGSNDNTALVIDNFIKQQPDFSIRYFYQPNAGKHIAINKGLQMAQGEWFHIADSDDEIEPETLFTFMKTWNEIAYDEKDNFCGIAAGCKNQYGKRITDAVPGKMFDGRVRELYYKYGFRKEFFHIYKTSILKQFPFPEDIRNCYYPEGIIWRRMTDKYLLRVISDELRIYYVNEDEYSLMSGNKKTPLSKALSSCIESAEVLNKDLKYFFYYPFYFFRMAMVYNSFKPFLNTDQKQKVKLSIRATIFSLSFILPGWVYFTVLKFRTK